MNSKEHLHTIAEVINKVEPNKAYDILCEVMGGKTFKYLHIQAQFSLVDESHTTGISELVCSFHKNKSGEYINSILVHTTDDLKLVSEIIEDIETDIQEEIIASLNTPEELENLHIVF